MGRLVNPDAYWEDLVGPPPPEPPVPQTQEPLTLGDLTLAAYELSMDAVRRYGTFPTVLYVGHLEWLVMSRSKYTLIGPSEDTKFAGLRVVLVNRPNYLAVGMPVDSD